MNRRTEPTTPAAPDAPAALPIDEVEYPALCALLRRHADPDLVQEIWRLAGRCVVPRASRQRTRRVAHLRCGEHDEAVLIIDLSRTGVRFLIAVETGIELTRAPLELRIAAPHGPRTLPVALVRVCGRDEHRLDVAVRFVDDALDDATVAGLRNNIFDTTAPPPAT